MQNIIKRIYDYSLEEIMGERFGRYSKTVIQDRALPDVRDGLKPVQRRILYAMYRDKNTYDKAYKKSAKTVGNVMGQYHPHGDSSIYEAMVRMSQWWKQHEIYVDMHGNNGSMDGDSPAAMRYTEARLSKIAAEMLRDIDKETVKWAPNYDDTVLEPTVLPAKIPALLVNGSMGISSGYATNIPPHNLSEIIDATIKRIDSPNCRLETILEIVKGPDFPTGGTCMGKDGIRNAFETGKGKVVIKAKTEIEKVKGKESIIIHEIPYEVNKATLVKKMDEIRIDKKIDGILEVRDESDREGLRISIDIKKDVPTDFVLNYLLKNTDMQVAYNYNMVAIVNRRPKLVGILEIIDAYIEHQKEVVTRTKEFDLKHAKARMHIVEGLIKALSILDAVIATIRSSSNKKDAIDNLVLKYEFSEIQAKAIVELQLYKLTNTDITELEEEFKNLGLIIKGLEIILGDEEKLMLVIKEELRKIKKEYGRDRQTLIEDEIEELKIDMTLTLPNEDCVVVVTSEGYVKRVSNRSYSATIGDETGLKDSDYVIGLYQINTLDTILLFTDMGNYLYVPVHELPDMKWKDLGKHINNIIGMNAGENIIAAIPVYNFDENVNIITTSKNGMVKQSLLADFKVQRYSKAITCMKLKDGDEMISAVLGRGSEVLIATKRGYGLRFEASEIPVSGTRAAGVKGINLKEDEVIGLVVLNGVEPLSIITEKGTGKRLKLDEIPVTSRAKRGLQIIRDVKTNPYYLINIFAENNRKTIGIKNKDAINFVKITELPYADRYSTGTSISKHTLVDSFIVAELKSNNQAVDEEIINEDITIESIDEKMMTIDDFLEDIEKGF